MCLGATAAERDGFIDVAMGRRDGALRPLSTPQPMADVALFDSHMGAANTLELAERLRAFVEQHAVRDLNIAGPRASQQPQVGEFVTRILDATFKEQ